MEDFVADEIESILYIAREISVYRIPPLKANEGYRAQEWGDLSQPLWKGRMRIVEKSTSVFLLFEDAQTGELFAKALYDPSTPSVEAVLDSSRYFVIRVEDNGRKAYIGMGFAERSDSFDFRLHEEVEGSHEPAVAGRRRRHSIATYPPGPKKDYSLKEGQTFSISIPGRGGKFDDGLNVLGSTGTSHAIDPASGGGASAYIMQDITAFSPVSAHPFFPIYPVRIGN
ncbi:adaptin ear-binding coat-associated protein 1 [Lactarius pseudohatsudake]|nr:adaptin ear-binding coat-associated protein 1 [Lactarius pseudohatsudake]